jgi:preprotein translocase subunit SecG
MSLFIFLTVVQALIGAALVGVVLVQRSEGGGLGVGGSPAGLMSARGAANFLTRSTTVLATLFVTLSIILAGLAVSTSSQRKIDTSLNRATVAPSAAPSTPADPLAASPAATPKGIPAKK